MDKPRTSSLLRRAKEEPLSAALALAVALASLYVVIYPFTVAYYPPLTDMPFHAAAMSIIRHYSDPAYHFREQFSLHFLEVPYFMMAGLGALLALVVPIAVAAKIAMIVFLLLVPAGFAVLFYGMKKSPLLGVLGLPFVWNTLTHWGFVGFMAALGLFAMAVGFTLLVLDRPTRARQAGLAVSLLFLFGTHVFRYPFALAAVAGAAVVMYPATRRFRPLLLPMAPAVIALVAWLLVKPKELEVQGMDWAHLHWERAKEARGFFFGALSGPEEARLAQQSGKIAICVAIVCLAGFLFDPDRLTRARHEIRWAAGQIALIVCITIVFLYMYLTLPMSMGIWWYVYPREILAALFVAVALIPDLPRSGYLRAPLVGAVAYGAIAQASLVADRFASVAADNADFRRVVEPIPTGPKLGYMVWDRDAPGFLAHPFIHMPAWVQAEKGGWLSFHFVGWNAWPIRYRYGSPAVPPPTPNRFEWTPERFDLRTRGEYFDWFLVRRAAGPDPRFRELPELRLVDHRGAYWLYHREPAPTPAPAPAP